MDKFYHENHFNCVVCSADLSDVPVYTRYGERYIYFTFNFCLKGRRSLLRVWLQGKIPVDLRPVLWVHRRCKNTNHNHRVDNNDSISQDCLQAMGRMWHPEHFQCCSCKAPISSDMSYRSKVGQQCVRRYLHLRTLTSGLGFALIIFNFMSGLLVNSGKFWICVSTRFLPEVKNIELEWTCGTKVIMLPSPGLPTLLWGLLRRDGAAQVCQLQQAHLGQGALCQGLQEQGGKKGVKIKYLQLIFSGWSLLQWLLPPLCAA